MAQLNPQQLETAARMLRVIAHPVRLDIIRLLEKKAPLSVGELQDELGLKQSMTSQHLAALRNIGVVNHSKEGNVCLYFLQNRNVLKLMECLKGCCRS